MSSIRARTESKSRVFRSSNAARVICKSLTLRELRFAASQQILPSAGNRKPASDRTHWLRPAPCSSRRRSCPGGERGDRQSSVPADSTPSRASPTGRRIGGYDYKTESFQRPHVEQHAHAREMKNSEFFWCPPPLGVGVFGKLLAARKRKDRQRNRLGRPQHAPASQEPKARWRSGSADRTAPEQVWQAPGLREFRLAESQQILPLIGNRKPASDRTHWLRPAPCSSRRRACPGGERGDRQSSVPAEPTRHGQG